MTIALVADLHGNMTSVLALEKDLKDRGIHKIWCLGDLVGKGPSNDKTFDWAIANCEVVLCGNWDEGVGLQQYVNDSFYFEQLGLERLKRLSLFPKEHHTRLSGRHIRLIHGRPVMESLLNPHLTPAKELESLFQNKYQVVGFADTHRQSLRTLTKGILFNTGSVGNGLGVNMVQYVIIEGDENDHQAPFDIRFITLPYDIEQAVREAQAHPNMPNAQSFIHEIRSGIYARKAIKSPKN
ncbi:MAG: metallophosphoesterase [Clostridiales bacterium]|nr:metallophosphoesterase [Clostridiales bacterium]